MAGSSCAVIPYSIVGTLAILMLIVVIRRSKEHSHRKESVTNITGDVLFFMMLFFRPQPEHPHSFLFFFFHFCNEKRAVATDGDEPDMELTDFNQTEVHEGDIEGRIDRIHGIRQIHFTGAQLAPITFAAVVSVFMSLLLSSLSLLCSKFIIFIYYKYLYRV